MSDEKGEVSDVYYTYMLRCKDGSVYTGITTCLERRMKEHLGKDKKCAKYTLTHTAVKLEAAWQSESRVCASRLEFQIKRLTKPQKERLIAENDLSVLANKLEIEEYTRVLQLPLETAEE